MASRKKEIEALRSRISRLEQLEEKEINEKQALEETRQQIQKILDDADLSFESFIRFNYKKVRSIITKIDKEQPSSVAPEKKTVKRKTAVKKRKRVTRTKATVKIPAGKYSNIPAAPEKVFEVKEKGPRPKILKAYAEELGLETFLEQCSVDS